MVCPPSPSFLRLWRMNDIRKSFIRCSLGEGGQTKSGRIHDHGRSESLPDPPCSLGLSVRTWIVVPTITKFALGFNPCSLGLSVRTEDYYTLGAVREEFQSLFSWIVRKDLRSCEWGRARYSGFQSLFSWIVRKDTKMWSGRGRRLFHVSILVLLDCP